MDWLETLKAAVAADSVTHVAQQLSQPGGKTYSRTAISLVVNEKYPASTDHIAARVIEVLGRFECPHLRTTISPAQCGNYAARPFPMNGGKLDTRHWRACQSCTYKGEKS